MSVFLRAPGSNSCGSAAAGATGDTGLDRVGAAAGLIAGTGELPLEPALPPPPPDPRSVVKGAGSWLCRGLCWRLPARAAAGLAGGKPEESELLPTPPRLMANAAHGSKAIDGTDAAFAYAARPALPAPATALVPRGPEDLAPRGDSESDPGGCCDHPGAEVRRPALPQLAAPRADKRARPPCDPACGGMWWDCSDEDAPVDAERPAAGRTASVREAAESPCRAPAKSRINCALD